MPKSEVSLVTSAATELGLREQPRVRNLQIAEPPPRIFCFGRRICWSSAFRLCRAADMLKDELQRPTCVKEKT